MHFYCTFQYMHELYPPNCQYVFMSTMLTKAFVKRRFIDVKNRCQFLSPYCVILLHFGFFELALRSFNVVFSRGFS